LTIDLNRANLAESDFNKSIIKLMDTSALTEQREARRDYLGASQIGSDCLRRIQYDWMCDVDHPAKTKRKFARGHLFEDITIKALLQAGFRIECGTDATKFSAVDGDFRGHADGIVRDGPPVMGYPCLFEHKALGASGWRKLENKGLRIAYPGYYDQVQLYMAYLDLTDNPALFSAVNADSCEILHIAVPYDAEAAQAASDRATMIIRETRAGVLLGRIASKPDDFRCRNFCDHSDRCWAGA
jgi:hypothetical protein